MESVECTGTDNVVVTVLYSSVCYLCSIYQYRHLRRTVSTASVKASPLFLGKRVGRVTLQGESYVGFPSGRSDALFEEEGKDDWGPQQ